MKRASHRLQGLPAIRGRLLFYLFLLGAFLSGIPRLQAQITGPANVCAGQAATFANTGTPDPTYTYNWSVIPPGNSTILSSSGSGATIQWFNTVGATETVKLDIIRPGLSNVTWTKVINVSPEPNPQIGTDVKVACQGVKGGRKEDTKGGMAAIAVPIKDDGIIIDDGACIKVCERNTIRYFVNGGQPGSTFQWTVDGSKAIFSGPSTGTDVYVTWGTTLGFTYIKVKETTVSGCVKEKTVCIEIIESPKPKFSVNGDLYPSGGQPCFAACIKEPIQFADLTPNSLTSPITSWQWDFGDGEYSALQNPQHTYNSATNYTVTLTVTNQCGCKEVYKVCIEVSNPDNPPLQIMCPSIVCENMSGHYTIENTCDAMFWTVHGGTILASDATSVDILWDNVGADGFGEIIADFSNCGGKCSPKVTAQVPVILATGTIIGKQVACAGKQYLYQLPKWPATNFKWTVIPAGAAFIAYDQNSNEANITAYSNFTLHCEYINTLMLCAGKADLNVTVVSPMSLSAPSKVCNGTSFSVVTTSPSAPGTTFTFIDPNGAVSGAGSFNITGVWTVQASNPGFCDIEPISVQVVDAPAALSSIGGQQKVCLNTPYVYTAVSPMPNTTCTWTIIPASAGTIIGNTGNAVTIKWLTAGSKTLQVTRSWADLTSCASAPISISIQDAVPVVNISGNANPCANTSAGYTATLAAGSSPLDNISWSLSNPALGSVASGQNTMTPTIAWNNVTTTSAICTLIATITKCGNTTTVNYPVTINGAPSLSISVSNPTPCSGTPVTFTATVTPASATVNWTLPAGSSPATVPAGTTATTTFTNLGLASQNFTVKAVASIGGCLLTTESAITIAVKPQPDINVSPGSGPSYNIIVCPTVNVPLLLSTNATTSINWYYNPPSAPVATGVTSYTATATGNYRVDVTNSFGCSSSQTRNIAISCAPGCTIPSGAGLTSKSHNITSCANSSGEAKVNVNFNGILGTYLGSGSGPVITSISNSGSMPFFSVPASVLSFPNLSITGISVTKPGIYPVDLSICYQTSGSPCCTTIREEVIVPHITNFDYTTTCSGGGYTLTLNDQTPILSGYSVSAQSWSTTSSGGPSTGASVINLSAYTPGSTLNITRSVTVTGPAGTYTCTRTRTYTVPPVITPAFTMTTTDPLGPNNSTCALRDVQFVSLNNTGVTKWTWDFGDGTSMITTNPNAIRTYTNPGSSYTATVKLTLTDAFGCNFSTTLNLSVLRNTFVVNTVNTYSLPEEVKCQGTASAVLLSGLTGGYGGNLYAWYNEQTFMPAYTANPINVTLDGQYWTRVTDQRGCQIAANPTPAKRAFQPLPAVSITGNHDYCAYQGITLSAANGAPSGTTYQWQQLIGASWVNIGSSTAILSLGGLAPGTYQYRVTATQNLPAGYTGACTAVSPPFVITVHPAPATPYVAAPIAVDCASYSIQLDVASPQPGIMYNWSNGTAGTSTIVNNGGAYRVWATDTWGCSSYADAVVPMDPASYFWRFPRGCYSFCEYQLPRRVDGPAYVTFQNWAWLLNGSGLPYPNGPWASSGSFSSVAPLNINTDPSMGGDGNGSGDYSWYLENTLCKKTSDPMSIDIKKDCCKADARFAYFKCYREKDSDPPTYYGGIDVGGFDCTPALYTIYALDPVTGLPNGTVTAVSGAYTPGSTIHFSYVPFSASSFGGVKFQVVLRCKDKECLAELPVYTREELEAMGCETMPDCRTDFGWKYFHCEWPYGATAPRFVGAGEIYNPFDCKSTTYTITAIDPATGLPNGTITPATGSLVTGWSPLSFTYTPNAGVTAVEFHVTINCEGKVCHTVIGKYGDLDNREKYPCEKDKECKTEIKWNYFVCTPSGRERHSVFNGSVQVYNPYGCSTMNYEIIAVNPSSGTVNGIVTPSTGTLAGGMNTLLFSYEPDAGISSVKFLIRFFCTDADGSVNCISTLGVFEKLDSREYYPCKDGCKTDVKWERFACVKPRGSTVETFIGMLNVYNPFADCPEVRYSITAVDPVTGIVNGTMSVVGPAALASGWNSLFFSYDPNPGVSSVRFLITFICGDKEICTAELGKYGGLNDRAKYPCRDYFKVAPTEGQGIHMLIAPNPANDKVAISYDIPVWKQGDLYEIAVVNLLGQTIANYKVDGTNGAWQLNTTQLAAGTYLVRMVKDGGNVDVQRMIIAH